FLDEPDVHLHPDLQVRFVHFLRDLVFERGFQVVIATHSTAILGALESYESSRLALMVSGQKELIFHEISETYRKILPVFGAHPLSNFFNLAPVLLVEGNDDERIWQQAVRSSEGRIKVYPCSVEGVEKLIEFENEANSIIQAVYNDAKGYSLRDRDDTDGAIENIGAIIRMKLLCRNAENLILSNEVLETLGISWADVPQKINDWLDKNQGHAHFEVMKGFLESGFQRKTYDIKEIRNDLMALFGSSKQWEVVVGQSIATIVRKESMSYEIDGSLSSYLGEAVVNNLILSE
ncbi:MAG: AAA family ATPase, partial [Candidatus Andersenbacteria bacterium]